MVTRFDLNLEAVLNWPRYLHTFIANMNDALVVITRAMKTDQEKIPIPPLELVFKLEPSRIRTMSHVAHLIP